MQFVTEFAGVRDPQHAYHGAVELNFTCTEPWEGGIGKIFLGHLLQDVAGIGAGNQQRRDFFREIHDVDVEVGGIGLHPVQILVFGSNRGDQVKTIFIETRDRHFTHDATAR